MKFLDKKVEDIKISYIGGGSRGWAWGLMSDLLSYDDISGDVYLYDIDKEAAKLNEIIGEKGNNAKGAKSIWHYHAVDTIEESLNGANFVIISILPGSFDEMESDVHAPEKYGIYQTVGDSTGPGGILRAMRTVPMYEYIAEKIKECCPDAWVINYTNPMTLCTRTLYRVFPNIKAFGCCHEVFGTQRLLAKVVKEEMGIDNVERHEIKVNPVGVNHFTWLTEAKYKDVDLFPKYVDFCKKFRYKGYNAIGTLLDNWKTNTFRFDEMVKMDLFQKFGWIAAAGDRHLVEFCPGKWYLSSPERVKEMHFGLTTVAMRREILKKRLDMREALVTGKKEVELKLTGEEGVNQIRALLGLTELITNVNLPNIGQIPNLPLGAIVETNAVFRSNSLKPVFAGDIPESIYPLVSRICGEQELINIGCANKDLNILFNAFANDPLVTIPVDDAKKLFIEMCENTKEYLSMYNLKDFK